MATAIWNAHYPGIISQAQIDYMLGWMYAPARLQEAIDHKDVGFDLFFLEEEAVGFAEYRIEKTPGRLFIEKLYLAVSWQGRGFGQAMLRHVEAVARRHCLPRLELRVNRNNDLALKAYRRFGFEITAELSSEIGRGFRMDDFLMTKSVAMKK